MSGQTWTPAPKRGIIPLHPLTFGMLLGRAFAALRHNPKVLFGFAVVIQLAVTVVTVTVMGVVLFTTFTRLETLSPSSPDYEAVFAGTIAMNIVAGIVVGIAAVAFSAMMQGVVAAEVGFAAVGVKATLRMLWRRMTPSFWRLAGFASLSVLFVFGVIAIVFAIIAGFIAGGAGTDLVGLAVILVFLVVLATIPLTVWLSTKLLLVPSILVLERAKFRDALVRSWRLTRGRFWVAWGVTILISMIMGLAMQVVSLPVSLLGSLFGSVIAPTGATEPSEVIGYIFTLLAPQLLLLVLQAIALVVQSTGSALIYLDCRMRYEGLDQTLISYVERRDLGWTDEQLGDPYAVDPERAVSSAPPPRQTPEWAAMSAYPAPAYAAPAPYGAPQSYGQPYSGPAYYGATAPYAATQPYGAPQQYGAPQPYGAPPTSAPSVQHTVAAPASGRAATFAPPPPPSTQPAPPADGSAADTSWAAPGAPAGDGPA